MEPSKEPQKMEKQNRYSRGQFIQTCGIIAAGGVMAGIVGCTPANTQKGEPATHEQPAHEMAAATTKPASKRPETVRVAADPLAVPPPITRKHAETVVIHLEAKEVYGVLKEGVIFHYLTFNGQTPAPMLRVRQGDTVDLTLSASKDNRHPHNVDFHSCYGSGGGAEDTSVGPGETKRIKFKVMNPGLFIYHCAVAAVDFHISSGMFGLILVEPANGLSKVDREFYLGQHEVYCKEPVDANTPVQFDYDKMLDENPRFVLLNAVFNGLTEGRLGAMKAKQGETVRIFFVNGGPNLISSFHPIGNIWTKFYTQGSLANKPLRDMQTVQVNPGSCAMLEMKLPVPETIKLADHSITRTARKGLLAEIVVSGTPVPSIYESISETGSQVGF